MPIPPPSLLGGDEPEYLLGRTIAFEEINGVQKNTKCGAQYKRVKRPLQTMHNALKANILGAGETCRWKCKGPTWDVPLLSKGKALPKHAFHQSDRKAFSLPFYKIATSKQEAPFYSPSAINRPQNTADLHMFRACKQEGHVTLAENADAGCLLHFKHRMVFQNVTVDMS